MADMRVEQFVDDLAVLGRGVLEAQHHADLVERHVQAAAVSDE